MVAALSSRLSREALHQRFTAPAAAFLRHCLHPVLQHKLQSVPIRTNLLQPFARVLLVDSSSWDVSEKLCAVLPGSGGNASTANCKLQTAYDYKQGELTFLADTAGTVPDNRYTDHLPALVNKTDLLLFDQGYFKLATVNALMAKGAFFLTRLFLDTTVHDGSDERAGLTLASSYGPHRGRRMNARCAWGRAPIKRAPVGWCACACPPRSLRPAADGSRPTPAGKAGRAVPGMWPCAIGRS